MVTKPGSRAEPRLPPRASAASKSVPRIRSPRRHVLLEGFERTIARTVLPRDRACPLGEMLQWLTARRVLANPVSATRIPFLSRNIRARNLVRSNLRTGNNALHSQNKLLQFRGSNGGSSQNTSRTTPLRHPSSGRGVRMHATAVGTPTPSPAGGVKTNTRVGETSPEGMLLQREQHPVSRTRLPSIRAGPRSFDRFTRAATPGGRVDAAPPHRPPAESLRHRLCVKRHPELPPLRHEELPHPRVRDVG